MRTKNYELAIKMGLYDRKQNRNFPYNRQTNAIDEATDENENLTYENNDTMDNPPKNG